MEWLTGWLKSIILVILLATFVELLLPNQSMQRYVKTVMSLFLLLTLLQPVLSLFEKYGGVEQLLEDALFQSGNGGAAQTMESMPAIRQQAEALKKTQQTQARSLAETQAAGLMKSRIEQTLGVQVRSIHVTTGTDEAGQTVLTGVKIAVDPEPAAKPLRPGIKGSDAKPGAGVEEVRPVQPVTIQIGGEEPPGKPAGAAETQRTPELTRKKTQIQLLLERDWQLTSDQIALTILDASAKD